jgi:hypothetical protein
MIGQHVLALPEPNPHASRRRQAVRRFAGDPGIRVALLSVTAAGVGLDFSSASVVIFAGDALLHHASERQ